MAIALIMRKCLKYGHMLKFDFTKPVVLLAPMAGLTDAPMRDLVASFGVDGVVSEMLACQEWKTNTPGVNLRAHKGKIDFNVVFVVQIAGRDPLLMAEVAKFAQDQGADHIDINMGCPAKKVTTGATAGASLLREPDLALEIIESVANAVEIPVTVKTRLGWDAKDSQLLAPKMESAGAKMLTIHGRTRAQKYDGEADWKAISAIKSAVNIPVIANGDIVDFETAKLALDQSGADGVMIGRASTGKPWLPSNIRSRLQGQSFTMPHKLADIVAHHFESMLSHYGIEIGGRMARKHLGAYFEKAPSVLRHMVLTTKQPSQILKIISQHDWTTI